MKGKVRTGVFPAMAALVVLVGAGLLGLYVVPRGSVNEEGAPYDSWPLGNPSRGEGEVGLPSQGAPPAWNPPRGEGEVSCDASYLTFLLLGLDGRGNGPSRSDAIVVIAANRQMGSVRALSLPRDLLIDLPAPAGPGSDTPTWVPRAKINTAYFWGERLPEGTLSFSKRTVAAALGIDIEHAAAIDMEGFGKLVDSVGGVDLYLDSPLDDERYDDFYSGHKIGLAIPSGWQHMDGARSRDYVRSRYADDDFARMHRQQRLLRALAEKLLAPATLLNLPKILDAVMATIITDVPLSDVPALVDLVRQADWAEIERTVIGRDEVTEHGNSLDEYWLDIPADRLKQYGIWLTPRCEGQGR